MEELRELPTQYAPAGGPRMKELELPEHCGGNLHIFDRVPGTCRCGAETWTVEGILEPGEDAIGLHHVA